MISGYLLPSPIPPMTLLAARIPLRLGAFAIRGALSLAAHRVDMGAETRSRVATLIHRAGTSLLGIHSEPPAPALEEELVISSSPAADGPLERPPGDGP